MTDVALVSVGALIGIGICLLSVSMFFLGVAWGQPHDPRKDSGTHE